MRDREDWHPAESGYLLGGRLRPKARSPCHARCLSLGIVYVPCNEFRHLGQRAQRSSRNSRRLPALDPLGISRIEAGFPRVSADDAEAIQLMLKAGLRAELWGFSRAVRADVEELVRLGLRASVIEAPTSDIKLRAYGISRDEVLTRV